uniref:Uncharacterized protein n=1 Tax=Siphoviridae sp. ct1yA16 TaxID=2827767 RepID=A0A8S5TFB9_9CAUD|nr:MAG TPA: hypothetical protein [Siphoviridae sp. ct1yA16]
MYRVVVGLNIYFPFLYIRLICHFIGIKDS